MKALKFIIIILSFSFTNLLFSQGNKIMGPEVWDIWNQMNDYGISNNGNWVYYNYGPEAGNPTLALYNTRKKKVYTFPRAESAAFTNDNKFIIFKFVSDVDSVKAMKRRKIKKDEMPLDTLGIFNVEALHLEKIPHLKSFKVPQKWDGVIAYELEEPSPIEKDSTGKAIKSMKAKKETSVLLIRELLSKEEMIVPFVKSYVIAEEGKRIFMTNTGRSKDFPPGLHLYDHNKKTIETILEKKGKYKHLTIYKDGSKVAATADYDTTKALVKDINLLFWEDGFVKTNLIAKSASSFLPKDWRISDDRALSFSEDGRKLYFGISAPLLIQDTSLLDEEIVNVEIWHYQDPKLYTVQNNQKKNELKRSYAAVYNIKDKKFTNIGNQTFQNTRNGNEGNYDWSLAFEDIKYLKSSSWDGYAYKDVYLVNQLSGEKKLVGEKILGTPSFSPSAKFLYWHNPQDSAWFTYNIEKSKIQELHKNKASIFSDELNDRPMNASSYRTMGWTKDDQHFLIYDRYDIWQFDPIKGKGRKLTSGRKDKTSYRYVRLDPELRSLPKDKVLLRTFSEVDKSSGYVWYSFESNTVIPIINDKMQFSNTVVKARDSDDILFTKQDFQTFPDLIHSNLKFESTQKISEINPQQKDYAWGSIEIMDYTLPNGKKMQALVAKPANFNPNKKYPMIVNFYERNSNRVYNYRSPYPHRSSINYTYYTNRGYVILNPDVAYEIGYPGKSALEAVMSATDEILKKGFVDENNMGLQGHSWGGYQIAHIVTKTDRFKCAEAGAPVVNMTSAYGGIRWGSGRSRMFQYEHTQSRIGGTIWNNKDLYLENSPLFNVDKINTPVLIMHNDKDGAVPWYQGIEFFVAMRRLEKPAWLLNYNDEPHWPVKRQNRFDFNIRLAQFFDHYLKGEKAPEWMVKGVPAVEKGINTGY